MTTPNGGNAGDPNIQNPGAASPPPAPAAPTPPPAPPGGEHIELEKPAPTAIEPSGDPALDIALEFFAKQGIDGRHPALKAARDSGDFSTIKALLAEKGDAAKGFEKYVDVAQRAADSVATEAKARREKTAAAIYGVAGGKDEWDKVREWATANADESERSAVNAGLSMGGFVAKAVAEALVARHQRATGGAAPAAKDALPNSAVRTNANTPGPLSPREFQRAVAELTQKHGTQNLESRPEYKALVSQRQAFRG